MNKCPDCGTLFHQPFKCTTCGAQKLYDATMTSLQDELEIANEERSRIGALVGMAELEPNGRYSYGDVYSEVYNMFEILRRESEASREFHLEAELALAGKNIKLKKALQDILKAEDAAAMCYIALAALELQNIGEKE